MTRLSEKHAKDLRNGYLIDGRLWDNQNASYALLHKAYQAAVDRAITFEVEYLFIWTEDSKNVIIEKYHDGVSDQTADVSKAEARQRYQELLDSGYEVIASCLPVGDYA